MRTRTRERVLDTLTLADLAHVGLRYGVRFYPRFTRRWLGPWHLCDGEWIRHYGTNASGILVKHGPKIEG
jgi:hypothetical protein